MQTKSVKVISFAGRRSAMDEYFKVLKAWGYRYVGDIVDKLLMVEAAKN